MKYLIFGRHMIKNASSDLIDICYDLDEAEREINRLRITHPAWVFWMEKEYDEGIQESVRPEPEL